MNSVNSFLERHQIDVGRSYGLLSLVGAVTSAYGVLGQWIIGRIHIDLTVIIGTVIGLALWRHRPWARTLSLVIAWAVTAAFAIILMVIPFTGTSGLRLTFGSAVITGPALWQVYLFGIAVSPACWFVLATLHSAKAKAEFQESSEPPPPIQFSPVDQNG